MKIAIIADDLTGANDSGVQLAKQGFKTSVILSPDFQSFNRQDSNVLVFDTDSRSIPMGEAYRRVREIGDALKNEHFNRIYKKMDSTLRGNLGAEIDAVYDAFQPDFVIIAPAFPKNGRQIKDGILYVNGIPVHETEVGRDPKTPVAESYIPELLKSQTDRPVGLINCRDYEEGTEGIVRKLALFKERQVPYVIFDAISELQLQLVANAVKETAYSIVWAGSAGLVHYVVESVNPLGETNEAAPSAPGINTPVLLVVGSVSRKTRQQLSVVLTRSDVTGIEMKADLFLDCEDTGIKEIKRVHAMASEALSLGHHVVLYTSGEPDDVRKANEIGRQKGLDSTMVSNQVAAFLGTAAALLVSQFDIRGVVLTGGDTARQVCNKLGYHEFELLHEVEAGVPVGCLLGQKEIYAVTKAGSFGSDEVLSRSIDMLANRMPAIHTKS